MARKHLPLYAKVPVFKKLRERVAFVERMYPGSMSQAIVAVEKARQDLLMGKYSFKELPAFEAWAGQTLSEINAAVRKAEFEKARLIARRGMLN